MVTAMPDSSLIPLNDENFEREIRKEDRLILVCFFADWAVPSRQLEEKVEAFARKRPDVAVVRINADTATELISAFGIRNLPTMVTMHGTSPIYGVTGNVSSTEIERLVMQSVDKAGIVLPRIEPYRIMKPLRLKLQ
jgi:thioredoxin-like negative regulator of GroEL